MTATAFGVSTNVWLLIALLAWAVAAGCCIAIVIKIR